MLEQPCVNCGQLLDVNVNICPQCGTARKRTHLVRTVGPLRWLYFPCCAFVGALLAAVAGAGWEITGTASAGTIEGMACLGGMGGLVVGLLLYRRTPRSKQKY